MTDSTASLRFERRPAPVLAEHRPLYKIGQLLLVLRLASRGGKSSIARLHLFNWALKRSDRAERLIAASKTDVLSVTAWGFDPALAIALRFAVAEGMLKCLPNGFALTEQGEIVADDIGKNSGVLIKEKSVLNQVGKRITESMVDVVAKGWEAE